MSTDLRCPPPETKAALDRDGDGPPLLRGASEAFTAIASPAAGRPIHQRRATDGPWRVDWPNLATDGSPTVKSRRAGDHGGPTDGAGSILSERQSLDLLRAVGLAVTSAIAVADADAAVEAARPWVARSRARPLDRHPRPSPAGPRPSGAHRRGPVDGAGHPARLGGDPRCRPGGSTRMPTPPSIRASPAAAAIGRVLVWPPAAGYPLTLVSSPVGVVFALSLGGPVAGDRLAARRSRGLASATARGRRRPGHPWSTAHGRRTPVAAR
ncbi:MAG: hypothetical protein WKF78_05770 [Candidatus Limnocylindrales bacterium]